jgi:hypothetical protein
MVEARHGFTDFAWVEQDLHHVQGHGGPLWLAACNFSKL